MSTHKGPDAAYAKRLIVHYFKTVFVAAGLKWHNDNGIEAQDIVDSILREAIDDQKQITAPILLDFDSRLKHIEQVIATQPARTDLDPTEVEQLRQLVREAIDLLDNFGSSEVDLRDWLKTARQTVRQ